jgi:hypothetical protein
METSTGAREMAEHALLRLVALRVIPSPSLAEVAEIASQVRLPQVRNFPALPRQAKRASRRGSRSARSFGPSRVIRALRIWTRSGGTRLI